MFGGSENRPLPSISLFPRCEKLAKLGHRNRPTLGDLNHPEDGNVLVLSGLYTLDYNLALLHRRDLCLGRSAYRTSYERSLSAVDCPANC